MVGMRAENLAKLCTYIHFAIKELDRDCDLTGEQEIQMTESLTNFIIDATNKYIAGQKEHGGSITDRDLDKEIRHEQIDLFWYLEAKKWKGNK